MNSVDCQEMLTTGVIFLPTREKRILISTFYTHTHFTPTDEKFIKTQWGYKAYFSSYKSNSRGVAILFNNNFEFSVEKEIYDDSGNYVILDCTIEDHKFILANIYGPNSDSPIFYTNLLAKIQEIHVGQQVIIAGDFNLIMDKELDSMNYKNLNNPKARLEVFNLIENLDIKDVFREIYPEKKRYSWRKKTPIKQARLDFFLVSESLIPSTMSVKYENSYRSDHSPALLSLKINNFVKGTVFWKEPYRLYQHRFNENQICQFFCHTT